MKNSEALEIAIMAVIANDEINGRVDALRQLYKMQEREKSQECLIKSLREAGL